MKKSNKILIPIIIAVCAFLIIINNFAKTDKNKILAKVNDETIYLTDFQEQSQKYGAELSKENKKLLLQNMINQKVIKIYAEKDSLSKDPKNMEEFEWQKNELKKSVLVKALIEKETKQSIVISDEDCKEYIKKHPFIKIMSIFVPIENSDSIQAKEKIDKAYASLESGAKFESTMKKFTNKQYRITNSKPEILKLETLNNIVSMDSRNLEIDEHTKPISTSNGYYIIKRYEDPTFGETKSQAENELRNQKESAFLNDYVSNLKSKITVFDENLRSAFSATDPSSQSDKLIASYGKYKLNYGILEKYLKSFATEEQRNQIQPAELKNFANQVALQNFLYQTALVEHIDTTAYFVEQWKARGQEYEKNWNNFIIGKVYQKVINPEIKVSEDEIKKYYQKNQNEFTKNGQVSPLPNVKYDIKERLQQKKYQQWIEKVKQDYQIKIEKYEKYL